MGVFPAFCEFSLQEKLTRKMEKSSCASAREGEKKKKKKAFFKTPRTLCSLSLPLRKTVSLEHDIFGFYKSLADLGGSRTIQMPVLPSFTVGDMIPLLFCSVMSTKPTKPSALRMLSLAYT